MRVSADVDIRGALNAIKLAQATPIQRERALKKAAVKQVEVIKDRTSKGTGLEGRFKSYSRAYFEHLVDRGKDNPRVPNLFYSGRMLANMGVVKSTPNYALISFSSMTERKKAQYNQTTRPFMGITRDEQRDIMRTFKRELFK